MIDYLDEWYNSLTNNAIKNLYIIHGFGDGAYINRIFKNLKSEDKVIVFEPDSRITDRLFEEQDYSAVLNDERFELITGDFMKLRAAVIKSMDYSMLDTANIIEHPDYDLSYPDSVQQFRAAITEIKSRLMLVMNTDYNRAEQRFRNSLANVRFTKNSKSIIDFPKKAGTDIPVIIVASGPSLDKNIEHLKAAKGKSIIVSVDSALPALLSRDIVPDMFVSVDAIKMKEHFADKRINKIPVIGVSESVPFAFGDDKFNYIIVTAMRDFFDAEGIELYENEFEGSVANVAFGTFLKLGFKNVILTGLDLAYTDEKFHAGNVINDKPYDSEGELYCEVDGIDGKKVKSAVEFRLYIKEFERTIEKYSYTHVTDATEGGALIRGTEIITLKEAIDKYCKNPVNISKIHEETEYLLSDEQKLKYIDYVDGMCNDFSRLKNDLSNANNIYRQILFEIKRSYNVNKIKGLYSKSKIFMDRVTSNPSLEYAELMNNEKAKELQKSLNVVSGNDELTDSIKMSLSFNKDLIEAADKALEAYKEYAPAWQ